ncbi:MAG: 4-hydroxy-tetrahydrodipicolinate reductase [Dethiobacteria bacterium]
MSPIKIVVSGAAGKMGQAVIKAVVQEEDLELVGAADPVKAGFDAAALAGLEPRGVIIRERLEEVLAETEAAVVIDFSTPLAVMENIHTALKQRVAAVVGTTGITEDDLRQVESWVRQYETGAIIAPNFSLGAVLMMKMAQICARYLPAVEIIECHHDGKIDAPSGTAIKTAQLIREANPCLEMEKEELEKVPGVRGGRVEGIPVHSVRLPGLVAHQQVIFGGNGQLLTLRHDSMDRSSFMPGLLLAVRRAPGNKELIYGMENLIEL